MVFTSFITNFFISNSEYRRLSYSMHCALILPGICFIGYSHPLSNHIFFAGPPPAGTDIQFSEMKRPNHSEPGSGRSQYRIVRLIFLDSFLLFFPLFLQCVGAGIPLSEMKIPNHSGAGAREDSYRIIKLILLNSFLLRVVLQRDQRDTAFHG